MKIRKILKLVFGLKSEVQAITLSCIYLIIFLSCKQEADQTLISSGDASIDKISRDISRQPDDAKLYFERAKLYYDRMIFDRTIYDLEKALSLDSLNPDFYHLLSDAYLDYYNSRGALNAMNKVLTIYPERISSLLKLAELKHILKDYDGSMLTLNEVIRLDNQNGEAYFMLGMNFKALGDEKRALNAFQTAVEMDSKITDAWIILGEMYEGKKDPKALQFYESAILSNPNSMQAYHAKAYYLQNHGQIPDAQQIYKQIILQDNQYADAYLNSGLLYLEQDSLDEAFEQFNLLTAIAPANYLGFYMRGKVHEIKGNKTEALKDYQSAHNLNKDNTEVKKALETLKNHL